MAEVEVVATHGAWRVLYAEPMLWMEGPWGDITSGEELRALWEVVEEALERLRCEGRPVWSRERG